MGCLAIALASLGLKRLLGVPLRLGVALLLLSLVPALPLAVLFMRAPV